MPLPSGRTPPGTGWPWRMRASFAAWPNRAILIGQSFQPDPRRRTGSPSSTVSVTAFSVGVAFFTGSSCHVTGFFSGDPQFC